MSIIEFISSVAWPVSVLIVALLFREPLVEALRSATGKVAAGPFSLEWEKQIEEVEADLGRTPPLLAGGEISGPLEGSTKSPTSAQRQPSWRVLRRSRLA
jgi:hypothetical protein